MSSRAVVLSITPQFATRIAAGTKRIELRRRFPQLAPGTWMYLYETLPVGQVRSRVKVVSVETKSVRDIWAQHRDEVGIGKSAFEAYFIGIDEGVVVKVEAHSWLGPLSLQELRRVIPGFSAPRSFRYLDEDAEAALLGSFS